MVKMEELLSPDTYRLQKKEKTEKEKKVYSVYDTQTMMYECTYIVLYSTKILIKVCTEYFLMKLGLPK